jgi:hypothetical protein
MILDWIGKAITAIGAFFASDAFIFALLWLIVPYVVAWGALLRSHRPWSSSGWMLSPLIVALGRPRSPGGLRLALLEVGEQTEDVGRRASRPGACSARGRAGIRRRTRSIPA